MASAAATDGRSRATIRRSRASNDTVILPRSHQPRHLHQPLELRAKQIGGAGVDNIVHVVEGVVGARDRHLLGDHQRAAAELENLPQRHQRAQAAGASGEADAIANTRPLKAA